MDKNRVWEDSDIYIIILSLVVVGVAQEVISFILSTWFIDQLIVIFCQMRDIAGHLVANFVCLSVILQVGVVCKNEDFIFGSKEEVAPVF
jgi:hypothetical protein